jgi:hypothetical protein
VRSPRAGHIAARCEPSRWCAAEVLIPRRLTLTRASGGRTLRRRRAGRGSDFRSRGAPNATAFVQREEALVQTVDANPSAEHLRRQRDVSAVARPRLAVVSFEIPLHLTRLNPKATIVAGLHPGEGRFRRSGEHRSGCGARSGSFGCGFGRTQRGACRRLMPRWMLRSAGALNIPAGNGRSGFCRNAHSRLSE